MLSGDNFKTAKQVAAELPIDEVYGEMLPADKAAFVKRSRKRVITLLSLVMGLMIVLPWLTQMLLLRLEVGQTSQLMFQILF